MVVLDAVHQIQAIQANDLAVRWNCKAGKCGSCSAEVNGHPRLMCMTRLNELDLDEPVTDRADADLSGDQGPGHRCIVEFSRKAERQEVLAAACRMRRMEPGACSRQTSSACRNSASASSAFCARTCATCCAIIRCSSSSSGPRYLVYAAALEMHPLDAGDRAKELKQRTWHRLLQHHEVLHEGVPGEHHDHRQRDHSAEGARGRSALRSGCQAAADVSYVVPGFSRACTSFSRTLTGRSPWNSRSRPCRRKRCRVLSRKAERYRLLNEPAEAESICLDALAMEPDNHEALVTLLLALTEQFEKTSPAP